MKLDRNINPNGRGKYALLKLRELFAVPDKYPPEVAQAVLTLNRHGLLHGGGDKVESPGEMFFVVKYKDKFAVAALHAYYQAAFDEAKALVEVAINMEGGFDAEKKFAQARSLKQYAADIFEEYLIAQKAGNRIPD